jgi:diguanylate cyclase (GGDEF)-like protein
MFHSIEAIAWLAIGAGALIVLWFPLPANLRLTGLLTMAAAALFIGLLFRFIFPTYGIRAKTRLLAALAGIAILTWVSYLLRPYNVELDVFFVLVIVAVSMQSDSKTALLIALLVILCDGIVSSLLGGRSMATVLQLLIKAIVYLGSAYVVNALAKDVQKRSDEALRHGKELSFLLDTSTETTSSLETGTVLPALAMKIAMGVPVTLCRVCLLDKDRHMLTTLGVHALHPLNGSQPATGEQWLLETMPRLRAAVDNAQVTLLTARAVTTAQQENEQKLLFPDDVKVVCFLPIVGHGMMLGAIIVGEARDPQREPFDVHKFSLLRTIAAQMGAVLQNVRLHESTQRQAERFAALVEIGRAISSTLELDALLELIHEQLSLAIPSDSYFVALYDQAGGVLDLRILVDEGQRFPSRKIPFGQGLATWVILKRRSLLIRHLSAEADSLPTIPFPVGKDHRSESWMGAPIIIGDDVLGLLAVASYHPYAFNDDDMALLDAVAQQAALAIDNAHHHAEVEDQARRDSLTSVSNHGYLLKLLRDAFDCCMAATKPISVIMLDIDHFKMYNDECGHVVGDEILRLGAQIIQSHIKSTDAVGRWGGDEFMIVLPEASAEEAHGVAKRIGESLANAHLLGSHREEIRKPTLSQGIATAPFHATTIENLIVLADNMLYLAKESGRDRIQVAGYAPDSQQL